MGTVAERLVARMAAPTKGLSVPLLVVEAVGRRHLDAPSHRERTGAPLGSDPGRRRSTADSPPRRAAVSLVPTRSAVPTGTASRRGSRHPSTPRPAPPRGSRPARRSRRTGRTSTGLPRRSGSGSARLARRLATRYGSLLAVSVPSKPPSSQARSQKGAVFVAPHRQSSYVASVVNGSPSPHSTENPSSSVTIVLGTSGTEPVTR